MGLLRKGLLAGVLALPLAGCGGSGEPVKTAWGPGDRAPNFEFAGLDGKKVRLSDFQGKVVLLDFWATYCIPCHESIPVFEKLHEKYGKQGLAVVGVSMDAFTDFVPEYVKEQGMKYTVVLDPSQSSSDIYGVTTLPVTYVLDRDGKIVRKWRGFNPVIGAEIREEVEKTLLKN